MRFGHAVVLTATGMLPNVTDKVDFEPLPFLINPPIYGFYRIRQDISLPARKPFLYQELIAVSQSVVALNVHDAKGSHAVRIDDQPPALLPDPVSEPAHDLCVYRWISRPTLLIAPCSAILPAVYLRVFGPGTQSECEAYIASVDG